MTLAPPCRAGHSIQPRYVRRLPWLRQDAGKPWNRTHSTAKMAVASVRCLILATRKSSRVTIMRSATLNLRRNGCQGAAVRSVAMMSSRWPVSDEARRLPVRRPRLPLALTLSAFWLRPAPRLPKAEPNSRRCAGSAAFTASRITSASSGRDACSVALSGFSGGGGGDDCSGCSLDCGSGGKCLARCARTSRAAKATLLSSTDAKPFKAAIPRALQGLADDARRPDAD